MSYVHYMYKALTRQEIIREVIIISSSHPSDYIWDSQMRANPDILPNVSIEWLVLA